MSNNPSYIFCGYTLTTLQAGHVRIEGPNLDLTVTSFFVAVRLVAQQVIAV